MPKLTMKAIEDSDVRGELSDVLDRYISGASKEVVDLVFEKVTNEDVVGCPEMFKRQIAEILISSIYIPMMMGEDEHPVRK